MANIIIIGSGIAGLATALHASKKHSVTLVTKAGLSASNTRYAQGGIAAATTADDSPALHAQDTVNAGVGLTSETSARLLAEEGPSAIDALVEWGVVFDHDETPQGSKPALAIEAAHSRPRVLHSGGDATGAAIETALVAAVQASSVVVRQRLLVTGLRQRDGRVTGIETIDSSQTPGFLEADAVVLATGGAGQLFAHTSNPIVATSDGLAAALRAGAAVADLEFYQFHPTTLATQANFLISEAVRGEGAVLVNAAGERFMLAVHPDAELAPRDVVARAIAAEMVKQNGVPVSLDARAIGRETLTKRFPTINAALAVEGLNMADELIPVTPAAHYYMGGVATDLDGRTSLPGLYAVGEVACTGVHGANRLASNSLLEGAVFARRVAAVLDAEPRPADSDEATKAATGAAAGAPGDVTAPTEALATAVTFPDLAGELRPSGIDRAELRELMWQYAGLARTAEGLATASAQLAAWAAEPAAPATRLTVETANLLTVARALVASAAARHESRGAHSRTDFPQTEEPATRTGGQREVLAQ